MRPVRLDLAGFATFRDAATVDFTDADYFAFVGPTGSGKSTVVDAMTFALYGSAPRWGSSSSIQYALAPTANRCTVRLVFDVGGQRYVVAREVRRSGTAISQKSSVLERYLDPAATGDPAADEDTESLAGDPKSVRAQVIELLGLEFDDFCTCVVLPQGDFATFLQASVTERQNILLKLIGAKHYDAIGKIAGRRAADAGTRVDLLTGQLADHADATEEDERVARAREAELLSLEPTAQQAVDLITELYAQQTETLTRADRARDEIQKLKALGVPDGIDALQTMLMAAERAYRDADERERAAATSAVAAQQAVENGPLRKPVEDAIGWWHERAVGRTLVEDLAEADRSATRHHSDAERAAETAEAWLEERRTDHQEAQAGLAAANRTLQVVQSRIAVLTEIRVPSTVDELGPAITVARATRDKADAERRALETELDEVRVVLDALPERSALNELGRLIDSYQAAAASADRLATEHKTLAGHLEAARGSLRQRTHDRDAARAGFEELRTRSVAADLRPHLRVGDACPVCDQPVATLPALMETPVLDTARAALMSAERRLVEAIDEDHVLATRSAALHVQVREASARTEELDSVLASRLPGNPSGTERDIAQDRTTYLALLRDFDDASQRRQHLESDVIEARTAWESADQECDRLEAESASERARLHATLGRLAAEEPPSVDASDLVGAWARLTTWCQARVDDLSVEQREAKAGLAGAEEALARVTGELAEAVAADRAAAERLTAAALAAQQASLEHQRLRRRLDELENLLADRPPLEELERLLAECERLQSAAREAREAAGAAMTARQVAEEAREARRAEWERARAVLHEAREPLVALGAPTIDNDDLTRGWAELVAWAGTEIERRGALLTELTSEAAEASGRLDHELRELAEALTGHGIDLAEHHLSLDPARPGVTSRAGRVPGVLMVERERARNRTADIVRRRRQAELLRTLIAKDSETREVAAELQRLMSSRRFPQWLADAALDTLVADASASLMRLSNNQFDLSHDRGEFFVIDHADADSRRSVRTLSGGETFQASLALALALSEQLSTLAAGGRTTLDSIFLDEGFGTLDPDALEIVAGTLENLAQDDRMVGVITHVSALAERVPVRYEVSRNSRTSTIERVGP